jgi:hypothetical protein
VYDFHHHLNSSTISESLSRLLMLPILLPIN